ncbi:MAG: arsenate reductase (glutaredoxin) [Alphaproteobacteria bacterium]|nr:arsenate reductase (glutaredoxin) [Alphaproteobacteria bacterium]MCZ6592569.1 arsenate reductase (glutaredoxin) [Alphaproteobacteria bacterium]
MGDQVVIYHNPRCSKSRAALQLLRDRGIEPQIIEYLKTPPSATRLKELLAMLGMSPRELMRKGEEPYKSLGLGDADIDDDALVAAMVDNPILIERAIVVADGKAKLGRPPETILGLL